MAERRIRNKDLARLTGLDPATISRLKNTAELKQITGEVLEKLLIALNCSLSDLMEHVLEEAQPPLES